MAFENVGSIEAFLGSRARSWTEPAHHIALVVSQRVAVLVVLSSEALVVVGAVDNRALLGSLGLMGEHVSF